MTRWQLAHGRHLDLGAKAVLMGILNVTPDSFSDGGEFDRPDGALAQARRMIAEGAAIIDVGGESTRPGAEPVSAREEQARILPVIEALAAEGAAYFGRHLPGRDGAAGGRGGRAYRQRRAWPAARARHRPGSGGHRRRPRHHAYRPRPRKAPRCDRRPVFFPRRSLEIARDAGIPDEPDRARSGLRVRQGRRREPSSSWPASANCARSAFRCSSARRASA